MILSAFGLQSIALRRQLLPQLRPKQNFIPASPSNSGDHAFQSGICADGQRCGLW
jgi:hypothetical protein